MTAPTLDRSTDLNWRLRGQCLDVNPDLMHPERGDRSGQVVAKAVCNGCPVAQQCLDDANLTGDFGGVRAGLTGDERRAQYGVLTERACMGCGGGFTPRTHNQHRCTTCSRADTHHKAATR
ncbi:WhiB family transcriptional regulator [Micromonospora sp. NBC_01740]|uniref:WhiB family transcriptional regulator n=1 Tax=Micromonospora sp. NBC_01740 TaxID=2975986 RepID=UPI002E1477AC|nr:WhiB family transcriptional regulator [Micromonospora sp. NBC_01740]